MKHRILTAVILVPLIVLAILTTPYFLYAFLAAIICLFAGWEWARLMNLHLLSQRITYLAILSFIILFSYLGYFWHPNFNYTFIYQSIVFWIASLWWVIALLIIYYYNQKHPFKIFNRFFYGLIGILLLYAFWLGLLVIRASSSDGSYWVLFLLLLIWIADSSAYFFGVRYGQRKLVPQVSPGKTIEGLYGELAISFVIVLMVAYGITQTNIQFFILILFAMLSVFASIIGDLFISVLKRQRGLKDTGRLLPGHGGLLDRIDSLLAAVPVFTLGLILYNWSKFN